MSDTSPQAALTGRSPFKLLDPYAENDRAIFFGREEEVDTLYRLLGESPLVLVYGRSGTGKTSIIQCGLTSKFSPTSWLPVMVRRGDDINASLLAAIATQAITPIPAGTSLTEAIRSVYLDHLRPIYFIFDQFEELYVLGQKSEQERFYGAVREILASDVACRMIVSLREEYLAGLDRFEQVVPTLFDKRLRVEAMTNANIEKVIVGTVAANDIKLENGSATARKIIEQIADGQGQVQLAYLQVYLDHLYRVDGGGGRGAAIEFSDEEVKRAGSLGDIMAEFLETQESAIQAGLEARGVGVPAGGIARLLEEFVSVEGTKQPITVDILADRVRAARPWLQDALDALVSSRLIRFGDGRYELAHDSLATHIAARRTAEAKRILQVERMVGNRLSEYPQTRTMLNAEELALVAAAMRQRDPLDGTLRLRFDERTQKFIRRSRWRRRRRLVLAAGAVVLYVFTTLLLGGFWLTTEDERDRALARANNESDVLGWGALTSYQPDHDLDCTQDKKTCEERERANQTALWLSGIATAANARREFGQSTLGLNDEDYVAKAMNSFWYRLNDADLSYLNETKSADEAYPPLLAYSLERIPSESLSPFALVQTKAVLARMAADAQRSSPEDFPQARPTVRRFYDFLAQQVEADRAIGLDPQGNSLGFHDDLDEVCQGYGMWDPQNVPKGCAAHANERRR